MKYLMLAYTLLALFGESKAQQIPQQKNAKQPTLSKKKEKESIHLKNSVFVELGGVGISTLNYQRNFYLSKRFDIAAGVAINPFSFTYPANGGPKKFSPLAAVLCQGIYKFSKNELGLGCGLLSQVTYDPLANNVELTRAIRHTFVGQAGYGRLLGKHIYSGLYTYLFVNDQAALSFGGGLKIGYRFGKKQDN